MRPTVKCGMDCEMECIKDCDVDCDVDCGMDSFCGFIENESKFWSGAEMTTFHPSKYRNTSGHYNAITEYLR